MRELSAIETVMVSGAAPGDKPGQDCRTVCTPRPNSAIMDCVRECRPKGGWGFGDESVGL